MRGSVSGSRKGGRREWSVMKRRVSGRRKGGERDVSVMKERVSGRREERREGMECHEREA